MAKDGAIFAWAFTPHTAAQAAEAAEKAKGKKRGGPRAKSGLKRRAEGEEEEEEVMQDASNFPFLASELGLAGDKGQGEEGG